MIGSPSCDRTCSVAGLNRNGGIQVDGETPYEILGVKKDATQKEIQSAYRKLAKHHHPDLNLGDKKSEERFKQVSGAYEILSDPEKRGRYDRGEIDGQGTETPQRRYYRDFSNEEAQTYRHGTAHEDEGLDDILGAFFARGAGRSYQMHGADIRYRLDVDFIDAINGATKRLTLPDGAILDVKIPKGAEDGQVLRLRGKGGPGQGGGAAGDALIELHIGTHPLYRRDGDDIRFNLPISLIEAVHGGRIRVPTPSGPVMAKIPENSNSGKVLRLKGKGVAHPGRPHGDAYVTLQIVLPDKADEKLKEFVANWDAGKDFDPRKTAGA